MSFDRLADLILSARRAAHESIIARFGAETGAAAALLGLVLGLLAFVGLADSLHESGAHRVDRAVLAWMQPEPGEPRGPWWLKEAALDLTSLGGISVLTLFALVAFAFLLAYGKQLAAVMMAAGLAGGVGLSEGLKAVFERDRPPAAYQAVETLNASFPSGHALLAAVFYLTLGAMLAQAFPRRWLKRLALGSAGLIVLLVGATRIYLGAHWLTDVLAGWAIGAAWAMGLWLLAQIFSRMLQRNETRLPNAPPDDKDPAVIGE